MARERNTQVLAELRKQIDRRKGPLPRTYWYSEHLNEDDYGADPREGLHRCEGIHDANLVSSLLIDGRHAPTIDIDLQCEVLPSSTPDHCHLYIEKPMSAEKYFTLLDALAAAGIVKKNYAKLARARGMSMVRPHGQYKPHSEYKLLQERCREAEFREIELKGQHERDARIIRQLEAEKEALAEEVRRAEARGEERATELSWG